MSATSTCGIAFSRFSSFWSCSQRRYKSHSSSVNDRHARWCVRFHDTEYPEGETLRAAAEAGVRRVLAKPVKFDELMPLIEEASAHRDRASAHVGTPAASQPRTKSRPKFGRTPLNAALRRRAGRAGRPQEGSAVYHTNEFGVEFLIDLEVSRRQPLERVRLRKGDRLRAQVKPYVAEAADGPVEVADLFFEDGTGTRRVPFACFAFVE